MSISQGLELEIKNNTHAMMGGVASDPKACQANTPAPSLPCEVESRALATTSSEPDEFRAQGLHRHSKRVTIQKKIRDRL